MKTTSNKDQITIKGIKYKLVNITTPKVQGKKFIVINDKGANNYPLRKILTFKKDFGTDLKESCLNVAIEVRDGNWICPSSCKLLVEIESSYKLKSKKPIIVVKSEFSKKDLEIINKYLDEDGGQSGEITTKKELVDYVINNHCDNGFESTDHIDNLENTCSMVELSMDKLMEDGSYAQVPYDLQSLSKDLREYLEKEITKYCLGIIIYNNQCVIANVNAGKAENLLIASGMFKKVHSYRKGSVRVYMSVK